MAYSKRALTKPQQAYIDWMVKVDWSTSRDPKHQADLQKYYDLVSGTRDGEILFWGQLRRSSEVKSTYLKDKLQQFTDSLTLQECKDLPLTCQGIRWAADTKTSPYPTHSSPIISEVLAKHTLDSDTLAYFIEKASKALHYGGIALLKTLQPHISAHHYTAIQYATLLKSSPFVIPSALKEAGLDIKELPLEDRQRILKAAGHHEAINLLGVKDLMEFIAENPKSIENLYVSIRENKELLKCILTTNPKAWMQVRLSGKSLCTPEELAYICKTGYNPENVEKWLLKEHKLSKEDLIAFSSDYVERPTVRPTYSVRDVTFDSEQEAKDYLNKNYPLKKSQGMEL